MKKSKRVPIKAAKDVAQAFEKDQVVIVSWDEGTGTTWVTSYGRTQADCALAANLANMIKKTVLGWPEELCRSAPARVRGSGGEGD